MEAAPTGVPDLGASSSQAGCRRSLRAWKKKPEEIQRSSCFCFVVLSEVDTFSLRSVAYICGLVASSSMICGLRP